MTPSINRLADSAKELGEYLLGSEWDLIEESFLGSEKHTYDDFLECVTGTMYYHALVCASLGKDTEIQTQLESDYEDLTEQLRLMEIEKVQREQEQAEEDGLEG